MSEDETRFIDGLTSLVSRGLSRQNDDLRGLMIERLSSALGLTIAISAGGERNAIETLHAGAERYVFDEAIRNVPMGQLAAVQKLRKAPQND